MIQPLVSFAVESASAFYVGALVENFGTIAVVEQIDSARGLLLKVVACEWRGVRQGGIGQRYFADPAKCNPAPFDVRLTDFEDEQAVLAAEIDRGFDDWHWD